MASEATGGTGTGVGDQAIVVGVFSDHPAGMAGKERNWLSCPAEGTWFAIVRMYQPHGEVVQGKWRCPATRKVG